MAQQPLALMPVAPLPSTGIWSVWLLRVLSRRNSGFIAFVLGMAHHPKCVWERFVSEIASGCCDNEHKIPIYIFCLPSLCFILQQVLHVRLFQLTLPPNGVPPHCLQALKSVSQVFSYMTKIFGPGKPALLHSVKSFSLAVAPVLCSPPHLAQSVLSIGPLQLDGSDLSSCQQISAVALLT